MEWIVEEFKLNHSFGCQPASVNFVDPVHLSECVHHGTGGITTDLPWLQMRFPATYVQGGRIRRISSVDEVTVPDESIGRNIYHDRPYAPS